jgi:hypothetical protein
LKCTTGRAECSWGEAAVLLAWDTAVFQGPTRKEDIWGKNSYRWQGRPILGVALLKNDVRWLVFNVHLGHNAPVESVLALVSEGLDALNHRPGGPIILMGDFNELLCRMESPTLLSVGSLSLKRQPTSCTGCTKSERPATSETRMEKVTDLIFGIYF